MAHPSCDRKGMPPSPVIVIARLRYRERASMTCALTRVIEDDRIDYRRDDDDVATAGLSHMARTLKLTFVDGAMAARVMRGPDRS